MHRRIKIQAAVCCFLFFLFSFATAEQAGRESEFRVERIGQMRGFGQNAFLVHAPEDGVFSVTIRDANGVFRVIRENVAKGDTELPWDACGKNGEPLAEKYYIFDFLLKTEEGKEYSYVFESSIVENLQHLQFVLPSGGKASLEKPDDWFVEMKAIHEGTVAMELTPEDGGEAEVSEAMKSDLARYRALELYAQENGIRYLNFFREPERQSLDPAHDFIDLEHMNII